MAFRLANTSSKWSSSVTHTLERHRWSSSSNTLASQMTSSRLLAQISPTRKSNWRMVMSFCRSGIPQDRSASNHFRRPSTAELTAAVWSTTWRMPPASITSSIGSKSSLLSRSQRVLRPSPSLSLAIKLISVSRERWLQTRLDKSAKKTVTCCSSRLVLRIGPM